MLRLIIFIIFFISGCNLNTNYKYNTEAADINTKLGLAYFRQGKIELAKNKLLTALKQAPNNTRVYTALGYFFAHTGEPLLAEKYYLYAIKHSYEKGVSWHNYGIFLYQQMRYQEALKYFLLVTKDANYLYIAKAYANASNAALKLKQYSLAQQYRKCAIAHDPFVYQKQDEIDIFFAYNSIKFKRGFSV